MAKSQILGQIFVRSFVFVWCLFMIMGIDNIFDAPIKLSLVCTLPATIGGGIVGFLYIFGKNKTKREILESVFFERH